MAAVSASALTEEEKRAIKAMFVAGMRSQDIHALVNYERPASVNFGRISGVKSNANVSPAGAQELDYYNKKKKSFDPITGLNLYSDERLIRSREAMILAVTIFNTGSFKFKTEVFSVLANIAWTYLLHEYYYRSGVTPINADGSSFALSFMTSMKDCPLSKGIKNNLAALKTIRDNVEHKMLGRSDLKWLSLFQACCLNFDKMIVDLFGSRTTLQNELSIALQFNKMDIEQVAQLNSYELPGNIIALDALLEKEMSEEDLQSLEYKFRVVYTFDSASKGKSHIHFVSPESEEGKNIHNVLQKYKIADELYKYKPGDVVKLVHKAIKSKFTMNNHTTSWQKHKVRPVAGSNKPDRTDRDYCIYHAAHGDYTYNEKWVELLINEHTS